MWSISQEEKHQVLLTHPDVPHVERGFTGVVAPYVTKNEKIGPETRADDIKSDEFERENMGKAAG